MGVGIWRPANGNLSPRSGVGGSGIGSMARSRCMQRAYMAPTPPLLTIFRPVNAEGMYIACR